MSAPLIEARLSSHRRCFAPCLSISILVIHTVRHDVWLLLCSKSQGSLNRARTSDSMPPPAALAWYGAVGTTSALSQLIFKFLNDFANIQDNVKSLHLKVKDDLDLIAQFMDFIKSLPPECSLGFNNSILADLSSHLQPLMIKCELDIKEVYATVEDTRIETYSSRKAIRAIESIEESLGTWVQRLHVRTSLLTERLKIQSIGAMETRTPALEFQYQMQQLSSEINKLRASGKTVDHESLWLPEGTVVDFGNNNLRRRMKGSLHGQQVIVEFISYNAVASADAARDAVGELAFILNRSDPSIFHILQCTNIYQHSVLTPGSRMHGLVFRVPPDLDTIRPLLEIISDSAPASGGGASSEPPADVERSRKIGQKTRMAYNLALSLRYLHSFGHVHQSIRSSNVLVGISSQGTSAEVFLGGFERTRPNAGASNQRRIDADWRNNIYRSPDRVGTTDDETIRRHTMAHDIYSLGVVLLELGIFKPLMSMESRFKNKAGDVVRQNLKELARGELSGIMGDSYADVVTYCLESTPQSSLAIHLAELSYVEEVIGPLEKLAKLH